jgi:site-specific DNA recombinase
LPSPSIRSSTRRPSTPCRRCCGQKIKATPPRVVTGPILLTGIATCASCGGMTLRTGKSDRYRYYTCATCAQKGKEACKGRSNPMEKFDRLVTERLADQLLTPDRISKLLAGLIERQAAKDEDHTSRLTALKAKVTEAASRAWAALRRDRKRD